MLELQTKLAFMSLQDIKLMAMFLDSMVDKLPNQPIFSGHFKIIVIVSISYIAYIDGSDCGNDGDVDGSDRGGDDGDDGDGDDGDGDDGDDGDGDDGDDGNDGDDGGDDDGGDDINLIIMVSPNNLPSLGINGGYSRWSAPKQCTQSCGGGVRLRKRKCNNPKPSLNGKDCDGPNKKLAAAKWCNVQVYMNRQYFVCSYWKHPICIFGKDLET